MPAGIDGRIITAHWRETIQRTDQWRCKPAKLKTLIKAAFPDAVVTIEDLRGDGDHYACRVVSSAFAGKNRVQQHQMVYKALGGRMGGELHALALQTSAPA
jgi:stress-induced morphogen